MVRHTPIESFKPEPEFTEPEFTKPAAAHPVPQMPAAKPSYQVEPNVDLWVNEQLFEEDVRAVLRMYANSRERLQGWNEYRTGGAHFRVTISWDDEFQITDADQSLAVPHMTDVLETLLVGSARNQDEMNVTDEFEQYRKIARELYHRLEQRQSCYE